MIRSVITLFALIILMVGPAVAAEFNHKEHMTYLEGVQPLCPTCHVAGAPSIVPDIKVVCKQCHEDTFVAQITLPGLKTHDPVWPLNHGPFAKAGAIDCEKCHKQSDCLECHASGFADQMGAFGNNMINVHRAEFTVTHPIAARTNPRLCATCHEAKFCSDCHDDFAPADLAIKSHRRGWSDLAVGGAVHANFPENSCHTCHTNSVLPQHEWSNAHAREARKNLITCQACHPEGDVCLKCHSARSGLGINPHPKDWGDFSDRLRDASGGRTCRKCH
jgi:hypothetical protein